MFCTKYLSLFYMLYSYYNIHTVFINIIKLISLTISLKTLSQIIDDFYAKHNDVKYNQCNYLNRSSLVLLI